MTSEQPESSDATASPLKIHLVTQTILAMQQSALKDKQLAGDPVSKMYYEALGVGYSRMAVLLLPLLGVKPDGN